MWTTVVLLGLTVSLEPTRLGLIALLLTRPRPIRHLIVFQCTGLTISLTVGLTVLFIFHRSFLGNSDVNPALLQIALGVALLLLAGVLASSIPLNRFSRQPKEKVAAGAVGDDSIGESELPSRRTRFMGWARNFVKGESSSLSASIGAATAMPSIDYFALLAIIIASKTPPLEQALALVTFLLLAGWAATVPLLSFIVAPEKTRVWVERLNQWIRSRTRKQVGLALGVVGIAMIAFGIHGL